MPPSRRTLLGVSGATALTVLSGCVTFLEDEPTPDLDVSDDAPYHVQLVGPETDARLFSGHDVRSVAAIQESRTGGYRLPIVVAESAIGEITELFQSVGVAEHPDRVAIVQYHGPEIARFTVTSELAETVVTEEWSGAMQLRFNERNHATEVRNHLTETSE